ncbi:hypothetical protein ADK60_09050 [Streptomyces sp. XY431]|uniref:hypothetical protein n=1 Tax=Streptomyces sp. XY431 TaxID=1415562 RepID=UPI0006AF416A|nr:hypothetical protein [Streptomyces sp. XY431]KOV35390.1 hypothetical protein ADK60_09050 [Streptomyces sp. XY431]
MTIHRILIPSTFLVLGAAALAGCSGSPAGGAAAGAAALPAAVVTSAAPAPPSGGAVDGAAAAPAAAPAAGGAGGAGAAGGAPRPTSSAPGTPAAAAPRPASPAARHPGPAAVPDRAPSCTPGQLAVTAKPVSRPAGRLLLTARNTGTAPCDLGLVGTVTFTGSVEATIPEGIGGGPNVLMPGQANHEAVTLVRGGAPGSGTTTTELTVALDSGATVTVRTTSFVHAPSVGLWRSTEAEALRQ